MPVEIQNITAEPHQRHTIIFEESEVILTLRFLPRVQIWLYDVEFNGRAAYGFKLSLGTFHMVSQNFPFDFVVSDESGAGIDPFKADDFSTGRCRLIMAGADDMAEVRGGPVPI